jgi:hypothetical protein
VAWAVDVFLGLGALVGFPRAAIRNTFEAFRLARTLAI